MNKFLNWLGNLFTFTGVVTVKTKAKKVTKKATKKTK